MNEYILALLGGVLIGISSSTMLGGLGRITGISGILGASLSRPSKENDWRYLFLLGLISGGGFLYWLDPSLFNYSIPSASSPGGYWTLVAGGLLVGFGTRLGGGCTSGHGVCGLARTAKRSFLATITFIVMGIVTVALKGVLS